MTPEEADQIRADIARLYRMVDALLSLAIITVGLLTPLVLLLAVLPW